ncbi:GIY-YIG nuclease family protein [Halopenitus persicus]|uniref:Putative endonuclease n=1 Tax=Halopenitus persicus TaxID=1048396 RepID=A0A1H3FX63_9EURY|nr:GIY-YIG nuclease family protein [Halopenitus persicus]QHS16819.1 GIY-YIG nuclease family protein [haloarchaeon 3A1-DGR]SDX95556.1 putative endonuclease [Halopenitus persicus]
MSDGDDAQPTDGDDGHHVYVLECADGTLYTGYTTDVDRRVAEHEAGEGAKYTRGRTPVDLRHVETFGTRSAAMSREYAIKQLSRVEKERLLVDGGGDGGDDGEPPPTSKQSDPID